jgi:hypothetical protein
MVVKILSKAVKNLRYIVVYDLTSICKSKIIVCLSNNQRCTINILFHISNSHKLNINLYQ